MKYTFLFASLFVLISAGCRKDREAVDNTVTRDNSTAENYFNDLFKVVDDVSGGTDGIRDYETTCIDTVIVDTLSSPRSVLIDFGQDDCLGADGRFRKGQILVTYTGRYRDQGTVITITPQNYTVNGYLLEGVKVVTNQGENGQGQLYYSVEVDGSVTAPGNAWTIEWESSRTRTWISGADTFTIWDDVYEITGNANGVGRFGNPFTVEITEPLRVEIGCPWVVSGVVLVEPENAAGRTIDFGDGDCNEGFTVTVDGEVFTINGGN